MSKQDSNGVRTAQDLERKYDFATLLGLKKNIEIQAKSLIKLDNELNNMLNTLIINLKDVLDSQSEVSLWFSSGVPTTSNWPYTSWITPSDHYGDIYYNRATGYVYQYSSEGWQRNEDYNLVQAMALTNAELGETSNYERKVFFSEPTPPYSSGDWWIQEDGTLYICQLGKVAGLIYEDGDFIVSSKYTTTVAVKQDNEIKVLKGTVLQITEDYVKYTDLSTGGSTTINGANITTGQIKSANYSAGVRGMLIDLDNGTITTKNTIWDVNGNLCFSNNAQIINANGLLTNLQFIGKSTSNLDIFGLLVDFQTPAFYSDKIVIEASIPSNFTVERAYITLVEQPVYWDNVPAWGYPRSIGIFKENSNPQIEMDYQGDWSSISIPKTQLTGIFSGSNTWTPDAASSSSHATQIKNTSDLNTNYFAAGSTSKFVIESTSIPSFSMSSYMNDGAKRSGILCAFLNVIGYFKKS